MMFRCFYSVLSFAVIGIALALPVASAQTAEEQIVQASAVVLNEVMAIPLNQIPQSMLANSHGVAIVPNVIKGSFIVGARHGRGILFTREPNGTWHAPVFITLTGGNIGWQIGLQSSDIVLVFKTARSIEGIMSGKLTIGGDAAAAAGPVGRQAAIATDRKLQAEIYTYCRSRGLFAGVSIDGSVIQVDSLATSAYYQKPALGNAVVVPASAQNLTLAVASYVGGVVAVAATEPQPELATPDGVNEADRLRNQLLQNAPPLYQLLDPQWRQYLALPASLAVGNGHPSPSEIRTALDRFETVAGNPQFQSLVTRPEFRAVETVLRDYYRELATVPSALQLPPPPSSVTQ